MFQRRIASIGSVYTQPSFYPGQLRRENVFWGISPDPYHTEREVTLIANRTRNNPAFLWLTEDEKALIYQKMRQAGTDNFSAYARKMLIDGYVIQVDYSDVKKMTAEIQKIGVNINQIARRVNATGTVYEADIQEIKERLAQIYAVSDGGFPRYCWKGCKRGMVYRKYSVTGFLSAVQSVPVSGQGSRPASYVSGSRH